MSMSTDVLHETYIVVYSCTCSVMYVTCVSKTETVFPYFRIFLQLYRNKISNFNDDSVCLSSCVKRSRLDSEKQGGLNLYLSHTAKQICVLSEAFQPRKFRARATVRTPFAEAPAYFFAMSSSSDKYCTFLISTEKSTSILQEDICKDLENPEVASKIR